MSQQATLLTDNAPHVQIVPFHGSKLQLVEHNGEPYTPMKPVVEGMGLSWGAQQQKLSANKERWGILIIDIPTSNRVYSGMLCMPLRKLPAFFASISVNKVREELRATIILFQNECDDALWKYWTGQQVQRECRPVAALPPPDAPLTPDQQCTLQAIVKAKVEAIPEEERSRGIYPPEC